MSAKPVALPLFCYESRGIAWLPSSFLKIQLVPVEDGKRTGETRNQLPQNACMQAAVFHDPNERGQKLRPSTSQSLAFYDV